MRKLNVGVIGLGRLGYLYAADIANRIPNTSLAAVADINAKRASSCAAELDVPAWYVDYHDLIADKSVDAVVVVTPTKTHPEGIQAAAQAGKAIFSEKPIAVTMEDALAATGVFFQMGFQRRFDSGYIEAKQKMADNVIGEPVVYVGTSRDPFAPPLEFCDPKSSGGMIADLGIHDFDMARWLFGDVQITYSTGGALAYPEMASIGDIDNAIINLTFESGKIGVVNLSRNAIFGYDIRAEIWGTKGSLQIGYFRKTPLLVMTSTGITHDVVPHFMQRFDQAYLAQLSNFVDNVLAEKEPPVTTRDGVAALAICAAATRSLTDKRPVNVQEIWPLAFSKDIAVETT